MKRVSYIYVPAYGIAIGTLDFVQKERLTYAFDIKGISKLETILKYRDLNVLIDDALFTPWGKEFQTAA